MTERGKNQLKRKKLFIYFITVNKYRFCISVIRYINVQIIGIAYTKNLYRRSLINIYVIPAVLLHVILLSLNLKV